MYKPVKIYQPRKFVKWLQFAILPELVFVRFALVRRCFGTSYLAGQGNVYSHWKLFCFYSINLLLICLFLSRQDVVNTQSEERYISGNRLTRKWNTKGWLIIRTTEVFILCILFIMRSHYSFVAKYRDDITLAYIMITADLIHIQYLLIFTFVIFLKPRNCKLYVSSNVIITYACHIGNWFLILPKSSYNRTFIQNMQNVIIHFFNTYIYSNYILKNSWPIVELGTIQ